MKTCTRCEELKPLDAFPKAKRAKDGRASRCNLCMSEILAAYRQTERGRVARLAAQARYRHSEKGQQRIKAREKTAKARAQHAAYAHTEKGQQVLRQSRERYRQRLRQTPKGKLQLQARRAVRAAIDKGDLLPTFDMDCEHCHEQAEDYHHVHGYERTFWLHVIPLCQGCHSALHNGH